MNLQNKKNPKQRNIRKKRGVKMFGKLFDTYNEMILKLRMNHPFINFMLSDWDEYIFMSQKEYPGLFLPKREYQRIVAEWSVPRNSEGGKYITTYDNRGCLVGVCVMEDGATYYERKPIFIDTQSQNYYEKLEQVRQKIQEMGKKMSEWKQKAYNIIKQ